MKERPILFSQPMVKAILHGRKTQTRRVVKPQPPAETSEVFTGWYHPTVTDRHGEEHPGPQTYGAWSADGGWATPCPYGQPGDRLWVREAHWMDRRDSTLAVMNADGFVVAQNGRESGQKSNPEELKQRNFWTLRPGIHMPRWACRLVQTIASVGCERLQDISEADAILEGTPGGHGAIPGYGYNAMPGEHYRWLWEQMTARAHGTPTRWCG